MRGSMLIVRIRLLRDRSSLQLPKPKVKKEIEYGTFADDSSF